LLEAVFFTTRVSVALNGRDNLYEFFSARRCITLSAMLHAVSGHLSTMSLAQTMMEKR
jgi:hypothetical protein